MDLDSAGNLWIGTGGGVSKFDGSTWTNYTTADGMATNYIFTIAVDQNSGELWAGSCWGVDKFDGSTWTLYTADDGLIDDCVYAIAVDNAGVKWFGTGNGVKEYLYWY